MGDRYQEKSREVPGAEVVVIGEHAERRRQEDDPDAGPSGEADDGRGEQQEHQDKPGEAEFGPDEDREVVRPNLEALFHAGRFEVVQVAATTDPSPRLTADRFDPGLHEVRPSTVGVEALIVAEEVGDGAHVALARQRVEQVERCGEGHQAERAHRNCRRSHRRYFRPSL